MSVNRCQRLAELRAKARDYGLTVTEYLLSPTAPQPARVDPVHSLNSYHKKPCNTGARSARAFDAHAPLTVAGKLRMARFARYLKRHKSELTEGIYNGRFTKLSVKNGRDVDPSFWGATTWAGHRDHVHSAI